MFGHGHEHGPRGCGPRGGGWSRGPFSVEWSVGDWRDDGGHGPGRGRGRRMFDGAELRLVLLKMIADAPRHGYELIKAIEELTGGAYVPSPGVVYPALTMLVELGLIREQESEGSKKRFAVTDEGLRHLHDNREQADALMARLTALGAERERTDRAPVRRAMRNLRTVLQNRMEEGVSDDVSHGIAALLDEAVQKIERLR